MKLSVLFISTIASLVVSVLICGVVADEDGAKNREVQFEIHNSGPLKIKPISIANSQNPRQVVRAAFGAAIETILASLLDLLDLAMNKLKGQVFNRVSPGLNWIVSLL